MKELVYIKHFSDAINPKNKIKVVVNYLILVKQYLHVRCFIFYKSLHSIIHTCNAYHIITYVKLSL